MDLALWNHEAIRKNDPLSLSIDSGPVVIRYPRWVEQLN